MTDATKFYFDAEFVRSILDYDPATGILRWRFRSDRPKKWNSRYAGKIAGSTNKRYGYVVVMAGKGHNYPAHRLIWLHQYGEWAPEQIDHINGARDDNRLSNLRLANNSQNCCNKAMQRNNTSGFVGVSFDPQRKLWRARINKDGQMHCCGFYGSPQEAHAARQAALATIHGEFAKLEDKRRHYHRPAASAVWR